MRACSGRPEHALKLFNGVPKPEAYTLIQALIMAAREAAEARCRRGMTLEDWPDGFPEQVRVWMLVQVSTMYENREAYSEAKVFKLDSIDRLLDAYVLPAVI